MYFIYLCLEIFYVVKFCWMVVVTLCSTLHISVCKQEVWPPDSADMVCPRPPLMRQIQHFVSRIKNRQRWDVQAMWAYELDLWPWGSPRLSVIHVLVLCQSTKCQFWWYSDYLFSICGPLGQRLRLITWPCDLDLWSWRSWRLWLMRVVILHPCTKLKFVGLAILKIWHTMCDSIN